MGEPVKQTVGSHGIYIVNKYRLASFPELHPAIAVKKTIEKSLKIIAWTVQENHGRSSFLIHNMKMMQSTFCSHSSPPSTSSCGQLILYRYTKITCVHASMYASVMGDLQKPQLNTGSSLDWVAKKLQEGYNWRCATQCIRTWILCIVSVSMAHVMPEY